MILRKTRQTTQRQIRTRKRAKRIERDFSVINLPILSLHFIAVKREKFLQELIKFFKAKVVTLIVQSLRFYCWYAVNFRTKKLLKNVLITVYLKTETGVTIGAILPAFSTKPSSIFKMVIITNHFKHPWPCLFLLVNEILENKTRKQTPWTFDHRVSTTGQNGLLLLSRTYLYIDFC